ncbi:MAG TPA: NAD-dependent epimerase/dehydratase family protein [Luteibacter sp.]|nr:NAD-dependent epimerase/dehydratase family protein [Luteibacter sp.]
MRVLVMGASGQIGQFLLPRLTAAGMEYLALSRRPVTDGDARWLLGGLPDGVPELPALDALVCLGPLDHLAPWLSATRLEGTPHIIATSSMSAETKRESDVTEERELSRRLRGAETTIIATCASRGMPWTLFRPTLIYGAGVDKSLTPIVQTALRRRLFPIPAGRGQRQPVHAEDIAAAIMAALTSPFARGRTFPIGGGERMSASEMFRRVRRSAGGLTFPAPIPRFALDLAARVSPAMRGPINRLDNDLIADNAELERILGVHPRPFQPSPETWRPVI